MKKLIIYDKMYPLEEILTALNFFSDSDGKVTGILQKAFFLVAKLITREWWQIEKIGKRDNCSTSKILYIPMNEKSRVAFFNNL